VSGIVVVKTDPKFDARQLDTDDGGELAELSAQIEELTVSAKSVNNAKKKANKRDADGSGETAKRAELESCCKELVFKKHSSSVPLIESDQTQNKSLIDSDQTKSTSLIESDQTKKCSTVSYCVSNRYFRERREKASEN
jgi:hypothetical protein